MSSERLILVEGEPGSGKSVALRHITEKLSKLASKNKNLESIIPLYINLKKLDHSPEDKIDRNLIQSFVIRELNRVNDRYIEEFLENEFQKGMQKATWLFLFDSFDEIPAVLSSVEADQIIRKYADAIDDFLGGFNKCRGVVASRQFREPNNLDWPKFRILQLENRRWELIEKVGFPPQMAKRVVNELKTASQEIQDMTKNPMFLGILCEGLRDGNPFPENTHSIFDNYLTKRITRDANRLQNRFGLEPSEIRNAAEKIAFCMSIDPNLGLSPKREEIVLSIENQGFFMGENIEKYLNALEYLKLAHSEDDMVSENSKTFTFAHRRFQEYFATCIVINNLDHINPRQLLTDGRWRETAVVIFQTQPLENITPLLEEAEIFLDEIIKQIPGLIENPIEYIKKQLVI